MSQGRFWGCPSDQPVANGGINLLSIAGNIDTTGIIPAAPALETASYGSSKTSLATLNGGLVSLEAAGNIKIGNINSRSANDNGGYISLISSGTIDTTLGNLSARSNSDGVEKGNISLAARGNIAINRLVSGTADGNAGSLTLFSKQGEIVLNSDYDLSAVITNGSVRLGVFGKGNLGGSRVGIDLTGLGDAIMPGCLCEGWGVAGNGIAGGASAANDAPGNLTSLILTPTDHGAVFDLGFGNLAGNSAKTFSIYYGATTSEATAMSALTHVNAEMYSLGQSSPEGSPGIFIFGFKSVGGKPLRVEAPPILFPEPNTDANNPPVADSDVNPDPTSDSASVITPDTTPSLPPVADSDVNPDPTSGSAPVIIAYAAPNPLPVRNSTVDGFT